MIDATIQPVSNGIRSIRVLEMHESCERDSFYVLIYSSEDYDMTVACHQTGSIYTNGEGLSYEDARERALCDAADWGDFLKITPDEFRDKDGKVIKPDFEFQRYETRRVLAKRKSEGTLS